MDTTSTIVAVASPPGHAARGIVRASGHEACAHVAAAIDPACAARRQVLGRRRGVHAVRLADPAIPALVLVMPGPASATGEDCVEVHAAGNPLVLERIAAAIVARGAGGARRAAGGEFSARAVMNGRIAIADAERVALSIAAETDGELRAARELGAGSAERAVAADADEVAQVLALVEAGIDFTDQEDVVAIGRADLERRLLTVAGRLRARCAAAAGGERGRRAPRVVLVGPPNAGKSSLFNALAGTARTVESDVRGTTRDAVELAVTLPDGTEVLLVDAPGLDEAAEAIDLHAQRRAADAIGRADLVLACAADESGARLQFPVRAIDVRTKGDIDTARDTHRAVADAIVTSARTGEGIDALRRAIADAVAATSPRAASVASLGSARIALLAEAAEAIGAAIDVHAPELVAANLRTALDRLGEVSGAIPPDDVLGRLFAGFCIGK